MKRESKGVETKNVVFDEGNGAAETPSENSVIEFDLSNSDLLLDELVSVGETEQSDGSGD